MIANPKMKIQPFLKWAGGKRWLTQTYPDIFPTVYNRYVEPFLGSGAVFFHLSPEKALLADSNSDLITTYHVVKERPDIIKRYLAEHQRQHSKEYYYKVRSSRPRSSAKIAARFLYLNRTCWNGLYRVNKSGDFNVPIGTKSSVLLRNECFYKLSEALENTTILCSDYSTILPKCGSGDFVFIDPPYTVKHNLNGFIKYNEKLFSWHDQEKLKLLIDEATQRGAKILISNADHPSIVELYSNYKKTTLTRSSVIAGSSEGRGSYSEILIKTWS